MRQVTNIEMHRAAESEATVRDDEIAVEGLERQPFLCIRRTRASRTPRGR